MIKIPYDQIISTIVEKSEVSKEEVESRINKKLDQLSGLISKEGAAHIVANEIGVQLFSETQGKVKIKEAHAGMRNLEVTGKISRLFGVREFVRNDRTGKVGSMQIGDETGMIRVVGWGDMADRVGKLKEGDIVQLKSAYVKENNGFREIHLNDTAVLAVNPPGVSIELKETKAYVRKQVSELSPTDESVEILGSIVQLYDPKFFEVCPTCGKRVRANDSGAFMCTEHNAVEPDYSYLATIMLDDGTENIRVVCFRNQVEQLFGMDRSTVLDLRQNPDGSTDKKHELLGSLVLVQGRVSNNQMFDRMELIAQKVDLKPNPDDELKRLG